MARIRNNNTASTADGLLIDLGIANASRAATNYFVGFSGAGTVAGKIQGCVGVGGCTGGTNGPGVSYTTNGADYAEFFRANPNDLPAAHELVQIDTANGNGIVRSSSDAQRNLVGAISTNAGFVGNGPVCLVDDENCESDYNKYNALVALSGQVLVKVNATKGPISIGDPITVSSVPGEGAKATSASYIVGYAQEALAGNDGVIKVLVRPQYFTPQATAETETQLNDLQSQINGIGMALNTGSLRATTLTVTGNANIQGNLTVGGVTKLKDLELSGHLITKGDLPMVTLQPAAGDGPIAQVSVAGNDTAGTITLVIGDNPASGNLLKLVFTKQFTAAPRIVLTPVGKDSAALLPYVESPTANDFILGSNIVPQTGKTYTFNYHVLQ